MDKDIVELRELYTNLKQHYIVNYNQIASGETAGLYGVNNLTNRDCNNILNFAQTDYTRQVQLYSTDMDEVFKKDVLFELNAIAKLMKYLGNLQKEQGFEF